MRRVRGAGLRVVGGVPTTATSAWFFAAARIIAGPPMSIFSTQASKRRGAAEHLLEGVEIDDLEVDGLDAMREHRRPHARGFRGWASRPPCTFGWRVLRPSIHHFREARQLGDIGDLQSLLGLSALAVPPVETRVDAARRPASAASATSPVLSETERRARVTRRRSGGHEPVILSDGSRADIADRRDTTDGRDGRGPQARADLPTFCKFICSGHDGLRLIALTCRSPAPAPAPMHP